MHTVVMNLVISQMNLVSNIWHPNKVLSLNNRYISKCHTSG